MVRRIFGVFLVLLGVGGILLAVMGVQIAHQSVENLGVGVEASIDLAIDSLETMQDSLLLTRALLADVEETMVDVEETAVNVGVTLDGTDPILQEMKVITTQDLPRSLETIEQAVPDAVQAAEAIDATLATLNKFEINTSILGIPIQYDLGIDYDPVVPFDESVLAIGVSLEGMPERLRGLETAFTETQTNLAATSDEMEDLSEDLVNINEQIAGFTPLVDDFIRIATEAGDNLRLLKGRIEGQVAMVNSIISLGMVWLVLSQVMPLYLGYELILGRLSPREEERVEDTAVSPDAPVDGEE